RVLWAVEEFLEQRVAEDRDEVHRQDAEQGDTSKHVEGFDAVSRFDGHGHRVSLPRSKRREGSQFAPDKRRRVDPIGSAKSLTTGRPTQERSRRAHRARARQADWSVYEEAPDAVLACGEHDARH